MHPCIRGSGHHENLSARLVSPPGWKSNADKPKSKKQNTTRGANQPSSAEGEQILKQPPFCERPKCGPQKTKTSRRLKQTNQYLRGEGKTKPHQRSREITHDQSTPLAPRPRDSDTAREHHAPDSAEGVIVFSVGPPVSTNALVPKKKI